ncbi:beta-xylosidase family glycoside hydrolase [Agromyces soli]
MGAGARIGAGRCGGRQSGRHGGRGTALRRFARSRSRLRAHRTGRRAGALRRGDRHAAPPPGFDDVRRASAHSFLGRPVEQSTAAVSTVVVPPEAPEARAGLVLRQSDANHLALLVQGGGGPCVLTTSLEGVEQVIASVEVAPGRVELALELDGFACRAHVVDAAGRRHALGPVDVRRLSPSRAGGFVGVWAGMAALGEPGAAQASAGFERFGLEHGSSEASPAGG